MLYTHDGTVCMGVFICEKVTTVFSEELPSHHSNKKELHYKDNIKYILDYICWDGTNSDLMGSGCCN